MNISNVSNVNVPSNQWPPTEMISRLDHCDDNPVSDGEPPRHVLTREISMMEQENSMLKNEVASLNQELSSIIHRGNTMHEGTIINLIIDVL